jgi:pimeloyl-ACP methyl ester carboxylesterase
MWDPQLGTLSRDNHVVLLDLPGYGLAEGATVPDSLSGFAESVHRTLVQRFSGPVVVIGHSFGGYLALELYRRHPDLFEALVLTNTRSEPDSPEAREKRLATVERLRDPAHGLDIEKTAEGLVAPATWKAAGPAIETIREMVRTARTPTIIGTLQAMAHRPDLTPVLPTIHVPTLVVWGEEDRLIPPSQTRAMVAHIRGGVGAGIPRAGHLPSLETPQSFANSLVRFMHSLPGP